MKVTPAMLDTDALVLGWAARVRGWEAWGQQSARRLPALPNVLLWHLDSVDSQVVAVFPRPRPLHPSERPPVDHLPASWLPVVWHQGMARDVERWLRRPVGDPPGLLQRRGPVTTS